MNYHRHLIKINDLENTGSKLALYRLIFLYVLRYYTCRPTLVKMLAADRYQSQKKLLYTVMTGGYDQLNEIPEKLPNWDYICYTDKEKLSSSTWDIRILKNDLNLDQVRLSRHFKINNHLVDGDYDLSVYIDANMRIRGDLDVFLAHALPRGKSFAVLLHPFLSSLEEEVAQCIAIGKDDEKILRSQYDHYTREKGFKDPFPHINARMMIRRSGHQEVRLLMETWFSELLKWSRRDQVAFNYALGLCPDAEPYYLPYWIFRNYFKKMDHS